MCTQTELNQITSHVVKAAKDSLGNKLEKVILYGSYARGDNDSDSDIDIMVLANVLNKDCWKERAKIRKITGSLDLEHNIFVSMTVIDSATFYKYLNTLPFYKNVLKDGIELSAQ